MCMTAIDSMSTCLNLAALGVGVITFLPHYLLQIFFHVLLNAFSICACFLAAGITGLYGTAVQLPQYDQFLEIQRMSKSTADV